MDVARRTYTAECRFVAGQPPGVIRWYWTRPGARIYPYPTAFGVSSFDNDTFPAKQGPGELTGGLIAFVNGNLEPRGKGQSPRGSREVFSNGLPFPCDHVRIKGPPYPNRSQALDGIHGV